jgi:hypothetical protein
MVDDRYRWLMFNELARRYPETAIEVEMAKKVGE